MNTSIFGKLLPVNKTVFNSPSPCGEGRGGVLLFVFLLLSSFSYAQNKEITTAKEQVKKGRDLPKAEATMEKLIGSDLDIRHDKKAWVLWYNAVRKQYDQVNEKAYLKQSYDTAALYSLTAKMFHILEGLDSIDAKPDNSGKVKLEYRKTHSKMLDQLRPNLYSAGAFHMRKKAADKAFAFFDLYLDCARQPLFEKQNYQTADTLMLRTAVYATICAYQQGDSAHFFKYYDAAVKDTKKRETLLRYAAETYDSHKDAANYVKTLAQGADEYMTSDYFFPRLIDHYVARNDMATAKEWTTKALAKYPDNQTFLLSESMLLYNMSDYDNCISVSEKLIELNSQLPEPHLYAALSIMGQALKVENSFEQKQAKPLLQDLYRKAMPHMETYRKMVPDDKNVWGPVLYKIYLNLNMGAQFDEIDRLLK